MKILVLHQYYGMPGRSCGSRFNEFARLWSEAGHHVTVVAGSIQHSTGKVPDQYRGRWTTHEKDGSVDVWRCYVPEVYGRSYLGRAWGFFAFMFSAATAALRAGSPDVVIATSPPIVVAVPGWLVARLRGARLIFEIRDLWPESAVTTGVLREKALLTRFLYRLERWACRAADRVNVLTPAFREDLLHRGLAPGEKILLVPNGADLDLFSPGPRENAVRRELGWGDRFVVLYAGAHGRANALGQLVDAAERLRDRPDILIATVGDGPERAAHERSARAKGLSNIMFCGEQPKSRMPEFLNACDVGAAVLQDNPTFLTVYPNKVFDYMACGRPTLLAIDGVAREMVCTQARAGVFVAPEDGQAIAEAIRRLADDPAGRAEMGRNGRAWVEANAARTALAERYLEAMNDLIGSAGTHPTRHGTPDVTGQRSRPAEGSLSVAAAEASSAEPGSGTASGGRNRWRPDAPGPTARPAIDR